MKIVYTVAMVLGLAEARRGGNGTRSSGTSTRSRSSATYSSADYDPYSSYSYDYYGSYYPSYDSYSSYNYDPYSYYNSYDSSYYPSYDYYSSYDYGTRERPEMRERFNWKLDIEDAGEISVQSSVDQNTNVEQLTLEFLDFFKYQVISGERVNARDIGSCLTECWNLDTQCCSEIVEERRNGQIDFAYTCSDQSFPGARNFNMTVDNMRVTFQCNDRWGSGAAKIMAGGAAIALGAYTLF